MLPEKDDRKLEFLGTFGRGFHSIRNWEFGQSLYLWVFISAFGLSEKATNPADQGLDEGVAGADLAVQALHLQQLPLQSLSETCGHVALQLHSRKQDKTEGLGTI